MWAVSHLVSDLLISSVSQAPCCSFHNSKESKAPWSSFCLVKKTANYLHMTCRLLQKERPYNSQPWKALLFTGPGTSGTLLTCKPPYSFPLPTYWVDMQWWDLTHHPLSHTLDQREVDRFSQNPEWLHATNTIYFQISLQLRKIQERSHFYSKTVHRKAGELHCYSPVTSSSWGTTVPDVWHRAPWVPGSTKFIPTSIYHSGPCSVE